MSSKFKKPGNVFTYTVAGSAIAVNEGRMVGGMFGIAQKAGVIGDKVEMARTGVWELPMNAALTPTIGDKAFWDNTAKEADATAVGHFPIGSFEAFDATADTCEVHLDGVHSTAV